MRCASSSSGRARRAAFTALAAAAIGAAAGAATSVPAARASEATAWSSETLRTLARPRDVRVVEGVHGDPRATVDALERAGYHVDVAVLPSTFFVRPRGSRGSLPSGLADVTPRERAAHEAAEALSGGASHARLLAPLLNAGPPDPFGGRGDLLPPLARGAITGTGRASAAPPMPDGVPQGARWTDTSEFMVGRVAVPLIFPESDGSIDADLYSWTPALRDSIIRSAVRGLLKWTAFAAARDVPLTFLIEVHGSLPTGYEPITRPVAQELDWIAETLEPLAGYGGDAEKEAYDVTNAARARLGAHWAVLLIAVQNDTDPDGAFPDGLIAHANLGGPWYVVPINNLNTSAALDFYMEHEMAHMFWALDEFASNNAWWSCTLSTGYFGSPNTNSVIPAPGYCGRDDRCVMKGNYPDSLCASTVGAVGWVDRDLSGTLDLYETRPAVKVDALAQIKFDGPNYPVLAAGKASDVAHPNQNPFLFGAGDSITIATIDSLWYRIDAGPWIPLLSEDGVLDQGLERFSFTVHLPVGDYVFRFLARNSNGRTQLVPDSATVTVSGPLGHPVPGGGGSPPASLSAAPTPSRGWARLALRAPPGAVASAEIFDVSGRRVRSWTVRVSDSGTAAWDWNGAGENGEALASGVYYLRARWPHGALTRRLVLIR